MSSASRLDPLHAIFTDEVLDRLWGAPRTDTLTYRVWAITRVQPAGINVPWLGAQRAAWTSYIGAAQACGLFADPHGKDLTARLTHVDDVQFRSAMAECQAAWFLSGKLGLVVTARPRGQGGSELEFLVKLADGDLHVEVKSPLRVGIADGIVRELDDSDILDRCFADASKQLKKGARNLVMLVGRLTLGVEVRRFFVKAFYAEERMVIPVFADRTTGPVRIEYEPTGRFLKVWPGEPGPRHTRVGGVLFVQENIRTISADGEEARHAVNDALMMHNPNAVHPLPEGLWGDCPQCVLRHGGMVWTDKAG